MQSAVRETQGRSRLGESLPHVAERTGEALHWVLGAALLIVVGINVVNATGRYLFGFSMTGTDELMVYTIVWVVMAGAILSLANRDHISVNLLPSYAKGRFRHLLYIVHDIAGVLACAYATYVSYGFVTRIGRLGTTSMGLGIPMTIPHAALLVGFTGLTITAAIMLARDLNAFARNDPHEEPGA